MKKLPKENLRKVSGAKGNLANTITTAKGADKEVLAQKNVKGGNKQILPGNVGSGSSEFMK